MSALLRALSRRIRLAIHRHDPIECRCELTEADRYPNGGALPIHDGGRSGLHCWDCSTPHGQPHELSCPEVSTEQFRRYLAGEQ
ncbi:MAG: hypothetical protein WA890_18580 [Micromonospora sp.]